MPEKQIYEFGEFRIDPEERLLLRDGKPIPLTPKAFETLLALVENSGHVVRKDDLMKRVWPDAFVEEVNLAQNVSAIRKALNGLGEQYIETVPKLGYRLIVKARLVEERAATPEISGPPPLPVSAPQPQPAFEVAPEPREFLPNRKSIIILVAAMLLIGAGALIWRFNTRTAAPIRSVVILPLTNLLGDANQEYFVDGITEELTTEVAKLAQAAPLRVISRTTAMRYKNSRQAVPEIARELNVDVVLEGAVMRSGNNVRITAQLIRAANDQHIWAQVYDRNVVDALAVQADIAQDIAKQIKVEITPEEQAQLGKMPQISPEAQDLYLRARYEWNKRRAESLRRARELFQETIELEPNYAAAWAGLADTEYIMVANPIGVAPSEGLPRAKVAVQRALQLDDKLAEAHASLGILNWTYDRSWSAAEQQYRRAIELNPNYATAHQYYALSLASQDRFEEAIAEARRAVELDPLSSVMRNALEQAFYYARRYDEAITVCRDAISVDPNFYAHYRVLGLSLLAQGHNHEALTELLRARELGPEYTHPIADLVSVYVRLGKRREALALLNEVNQRARNQYVMPSLFAHMYADLGETDTAFEWLNKAVEEQRTTQMVQLNVPEWDVLRGDSRFAGVVKRVSGQ